MDPNLDNMSVKNASIFKFLDVKKNSEKDKFLDTLLFFI
jgi:hypothetical protein